MLLIVLLFGCSGEYPAMYPENHLGPAEAGPILVDDNGVLRRDVNRPMRRVRNPTGGGSDEEIPCSEGEEDRWVRVPCDSWDFDDSPVWSETQDRWICPTCIVNVCGQPLETGDLPTGWEFPTCPDRRTPIDNGNERSRHVRR